MKKSERTQLTISKIMEAAIIEFGENGYSGGTVNNICKTINKGLIYHNFEGKDSLYLACLNHSCSKLVDFLNQRATNMESYLTARMDFFSQNPKEARIFFDALLSPPGHLFEEITQALQEFNELNEKIYSQTLEGLILRDGINNEEATSYFHLMQTMLNGYFSSPTFQNADMGQKVELHEKTVSKLLDYMLYGIAKEDL